MTDKKPGTMLLPLLALLLFSCGEEKQQQTGSGVKNVSIFKLEESENVSVFEGFGNLSFRKKADITAAVDGTIEEIFFDEGDSVDQGSRLASMSNLQLEIRGEQAEAALISANSAWELSKAEYREAKLSVESRLIALDKSRLNLLQKEKELTHQRSLMENKKKLLTLGGITPEEVLSLELSLSSLETEVLALKKDISIQNIGFRDEDIESLGFSLPVNAEDRKEVLLDINTRTLLSGMQVARARIKSAETDLRSAEVLLDEMQLYSPIDGIVGAKYLEKGERVQADSRVFTIFNSSEIDLVFQVPEEIGVLLHPEQEVSLIIDAVPDTEFISIIRLISPAVDPRSGNITVKARLENSNGRLRPGMFARFSLNYGRTRECLRMPSECLVHKDGNRGLIFRINGGRVYPVTLSLGEEKAGFIEVTAGIAAGALIVRNPSPLLSEGEEVNAQ